MLKKTISILLAVILIAGAALFAPSASADDGAAAFGIDKTYLVVGDTLTVSNPDGYELRYYVGDDEVDVPSFSLRTSYYENWIYVRAYDGDTLVAEDSVYFSKLPVLYINTEGSQSITSKEEYLAGDLFIQNNEATDAAMYSGALKIKGRGNSTWDWPKKPYRIKLDKKTDLFGMGKNKNWVLLANYLDESMLRTATGFQISEQLGLTTMKSVWTDVVLNGEYVGNYQLCEHIRIDDGRVEVFDWENEAEEIASAVNKTEKKLGNKIDKDALEDCLKENLSWVTSGKFVFNEKEYTVSDYYEAEDDYSGGYLFELSNEYDEASRFTTRAGLKVMVKSPEFLNTDSAMMSYVKKYWQDFENAYRSEDGYVRTADGPKHYSEFAVFDTMVSYWLCMEIMGNDDATYKSRFAYKDIGGLIEFGPAWDFDWGCGSLFVGIKPTGWKLAQTNATKNRQNFFKEFLDDPVFIARATEKYWEIRPFLQTLITGGGVLDAEIAYLKESGAADQARWNRKDYWKNPRGFTKDASVVKSYLTNRFAWLDEQFATDDALLESTRSELSASPYLRDNEGLAVKLHNASADTFTEHAPADGVIRSGRDAFIGLDVGEDTAEVKVYVNGLYSDTVQTADGTALIDVPADALKAENEGKTVISLIGKNAAGETTGRNFTTVIQRVSDEPIILGDTDGDGRVTVIDVTCIQRYLAGLPVGSFSYDASNLSGKGLSILDATAIQKYLADFEVEYAIGEEFV